jgi:uncharacterized OB-fold protein
VLDDWTLPALTPWNEAWFTSGGIAVQRCSRCSLLQHPPEEVCHGCGSLAFETTEMAPRGTVHSFTIVHHAAHPGLAPWVPYTVVLVSLDDAPDIRVVGNLIGASPSEVHIGSAVAATWQERPSDDDRIIRLVQWVPA